jgi:hypothetical protein
MKLLAAYLILILANALLLLALAASPLDGEPAMYFVPVLALAAFCVALFIRPVRRRWLHVLVGIPVCAVAWFVALTIVSMSGFGTGSAFDRAMSYLDGHTIQTMERDGFNQAFEPFVRNPHQMHDFLVEKMGSDDPKESITACLALASVGKFAQHLQSGTTNRVPTEVVRMIDPEALLKTSQGLKTGDQPARWADWLAFAQELMKGTIEQPLSPPVDNTKTPP